MILMLCIIYSYIVLFVFTFLIINLDDFFASEKQTNQEKNVITVILLTSVGLLTTIKNYSISDCKSDTH